MGSKSKRRAGRHEAPGGLRQEVERLIAKGRLKDAVKRGQALLQAGGHAGEPSAARTRATSSGRSSSGENGMPAAAQEVAQHLLDFGVTDPALIETGGRGSWWRWGWPRRALELQGRLDSPEARERLARQAADQAVLHPERAAEAPPEVRDGAATVRAALEALQAGDEAKALEALRDVARSSPFADWKLFVRGLAAFSPPRRRRGAAPTGTGSTPAAPAARIAARCSPWPATDADAAGRTPRRASTPWRSGSSASRSSTRSSSSARWWPRTAGTRRSGGSAPLRLAPPADRPEAGRAADAGPVSAR